MKYVIILFTFIFLLLTFYPNKNVENDLKTKTVIYLSNNKYYISQSVISQVNISGDSVGINVSNTSSNTNIGQSSYILPLPNGVGIITSPMGNRWGAYHKGWDIAAPRGTEIYSIGDGYIAQAKKQGPQVGYLNSPYGFGWRVIVNYKDVNAGEFCIIYAHMNEFAKDWQVGDVVKQGDLLGYVGSSGDSSGNHLHFQMSPVNKYGEYMNPFTRLFKIKITEEDIETKLHLKINSGVSLEGVPE